MKPSLNAKQERLAAALRENLKRRKAQALIAKAKAAEAPPPRPSSGMKKA